MHCEEDDDKAVEEAINSGADVDWANAVSDLDRQSTECRFETSRLYYVPLYIILPHNYYFVIVTVEKQYYQQLPNLRKTALCLTSK